MQVREAAAPRRSFVAAVAEAPEEEEDLEMAHHGGPGAAFARSLPPHAHGRKGADVEAMSLLGAQHGGGGKGKAEGEGLLPARDAPAGVSSSGAGRGKAEPGGGVDPAWEDLLKDGSRGAAAPKKPNEEDDEEAGGQASAAEGDCVPLLQQEAEGQEGAGRGATTPAPGNAASSGSTAGAKGGTSAKQQKKKKGRKR